MPIPDGDSPASSADPANSEALPPIWMAFALSLAPAVSNGLGRFAYALILPAMRTDLRWSYTDAGWVNTINALGYLAGALTTLRLIVRRGPHRLLAWGLLSTAASLIASGFFRNFTALVAVRFIAGWGGALALIAGGALAAELYAKHPARASAGIAIYFSGGGIGIVVPGLLLPSLLQARGAPAWTEAWIATGVLALLFCIPCLAAAARIPALPRNSSNEPWKKRPLLGSLIGYFTFALGAIVYMTFIIAWMRDRGATPFEVSLVWSVLGLAIMISPLPWRRALATWPGGWPLSASLLACAMGAAIPLVSTALPAMLLSALFFGGSFFIPPSAITGLARARLPRSAWGAALATYTVLFGIGQPLGPIFAGAVADVTGSLFTGLAISVAVLVLGAVAAALQK